MQSFNSKCLFSLFTMVTVAGLLFICSASSVQVTELSSFGIMAEDHTWKKESISVCWAQKDQIEDLQQMSVMTTVDQEVTTELNDIDKLVIQNKIQEQFSKEAVGIEFVGWKRCDSSAKSDIYIFAFAEMTYAEYYLPGETNIGTSCEMFNPELRKKEIRTRVAGQPGYLFLSKDTMRKLGPKLFKRPDISFVRSALHEFGHIAGLLHEHYHKDAKLDPNCQELIKENPDFTTNPISLGKEKAYSEYDPRSIMNGCFVINEDSKDQQSVSDVRLSDLDRHVLQCIYKSADQYDKTKCHSSEYKESVVE